MVLVSTFLVGLVPRGNKLPGKLEEKAIELISKQIDVLGTKVKAGDIIEVLIAGLIIALIVFALVGNVTTFFGPMIDIILGFLLVLLAVTTAIRFNTNLKGLSKIMPACHDVTNKLAYCARHRGFHVGFFFWSVAFIILNGPIVTVICSLNDSIWFGPFLLILLLGLPLHGIKTKMGEKSTLEFKFWSAFFWILVAISFGFYIYYSFSQPC